MSAVEKEGYISLANQAFAAAKVLHALAMVSPAFADELTKQAQEWQARATPYWALAFPSRRSVAA